jgi:heat-inducible transcriptional repressor
MLVVITNTGRVEQRVVDCPGPVDDALLADLRARVNALAVGRRLTDVADAVDTLPDAFALTDRPAVAAVVATLVETLVEDSEERVLLAGTANLTRFGQDFPATVQPVLEALEEQVVLMRLLGEATGPDEVSVRIGHENSFEGLSGTSVVTVGYGEEEMVARMGVVGPTRMDYPGTIRAVRAVARYVGRIVTES